LRKITLLEALLLVGIIVSVYLTYVHYYPGYLACFKSSIVDCSAVITSSYSVIFGIPLAIYSIAWFAIAFLLVRYKTLKTLTEIWFLIGVGGIFYSFFSMYMLSKVCVYCLALDAIIAICIFLLFRRKI